MAIDGYKIVIHPHNLHATDKEIKEENKYIIHSSGIYLHGQLEIDNGYDLCGIENFPNESSPEDGFYCIVVMRNGEKRKARLFLWEVKKLSRPNRSFWKGLIVQEGDNEYMKDAQRKRKRKEEDI